MSVAKATSAALWAPCAAGPGVTGGGLELTAAIDDAAAGCELAVIPDPFDADPQAATDSATPTAETVSTSPRRMGTICRVEIIAVPPLVGDWGGPYNPGRSTSTSASA
jgi:hypothetical protein